MKKITLVIVLLFIRFCGYSQTPLTVGDIAFMGSNSIGAIDIDGGSTDNVGIVSYAVDIDTFTCADIGTPVAITLTVMNAAGNSDTCNI